VSIADQDPDARSAVLVARADDVRGQGSAEARMTMTVGANGGADTAAVRIVTDLSLTGRAAQMGRGVVEGVARRLVADMAECLETGLGAAGAVPAPAPTSRDSFWERLRRLLRGERHA
jgi:carbon monoxide dehydrogenase subunit G